MWAAASLADVSAILHIYFAFAFFPDQPGMQIAFIGMGIVYFVGTGMALAGYKVDLTLKAGAIWVVLLLLTWAGGAAAGRAVNHDPLSYVDKAVEGGLLVLILLLIRSRTAAAPDATAGTADQSTPPD